MLIKLLRNTVVDGLPGSAGQTVNAREETALLLVRMGKAKNAISAEPVTVVADEPISPVIADQTSAPVVADEPIAPPPPARHGRDSKSGKGKGK